MEASPTSSPSSVSQILVLSWGSLLAYPRFFMDMPDLWQGSITQRGYWHKGGPILPIEFSRKCDDGSLMSVVDHVNGVATETHYVALYQRPGFDLYNDSLVQDEKSKKMFEDIKKRLRKTFLFVSGDAITAEEEAKMCCECNGLKIEDPKVFHVHDEGMIGYMISSGSQEKHSDSHPGTLKIIHDWLDQYRIQHNLQRDTIAVFWIDFAPNFERFTVFRASNFVRDDVHRSRGLSGNQLTSWSSSMLRHMNKIITTSRDLVHSKVRGFIEREYLSHFLSVKPAMIYSVYSASSSSLDSVKHWIFKKTFIGRNDYIEYVEGNIPVVLSAPHGGRLKPVEIPDRTTGVLDGDTNTLELAHEIFEEIANVCSTDDEVRVPHLILCHLKRSKIDANRDMKDAAAGQEFAEEAWHEYNNFIEIAKRKSLEKFGKAHYFDIHGNTASVKIMLGHAIRKVDTEQRNLGHLADQLAYSSIRSLAETKPDTKSKIELLVGKTSLAQLLFDQGVECTPHLHANQDVDQLLASQSLASFDWGGNSFYEGGYNTRRHGTIRFNDQCNATQIETPIEWRRTSSKRRFMAKGFAQATIQFFQIHYGIDLRKI